MHSTPKISISIPVYNVDKFLNNCLDRIIHQTFQDIEIIIVDDGSTDSSGNICDLYAANDSRIKVIHKANGGLASARQAALEVARGEYFCACDSDDWVELDMYEHLYKRAQETDADIIICDYYVEYDNGKSVRRHLERINNAENDFLGFALKGKFPCMVWNKLYKREIFQNYNINWEQGIDLGEDFLITLKIFQHPVHIEYIQKPLYHYRRNIHGESYTNNISLKTYNQNIYIRNWISENIDTQKYQDALFRLWLNSAFTGLRVSDGIDTLYYKTTIMKNLPFTGFFKYHYTKMKGLIIFFTKIFGYNFGKKIYQLFYKYFYK